MADGRRMITLLLSACQDLNISKLSDEPTWWQSSEDRWARVDVGDVAACAVALDGSLACWPRGLVWTDSPPTGTFVDVSVLVDGALVVTDDGRLGSWFIGNTRGLPFVPWRELFVPAAAKPVRDALASHAGQIAVSNQSSVVSLRAGFAVPPWFGSVDVAGGKEWDVWPCLYSLSSGGEIRHRCGWSGDSLPDLSLEPLPDLSALEPAIDIDTIFAGICALSVGGRVTCAYPFEPPILEGTYTAIAGSDTEICGLDPDGRVHCAAPPGEDLRAGPPPADVQFKMIEGGRSTFCGVTLDDAIVCWGNDDGGLAHPP